MPPCRALGPGIRGRAVDRRFPVPPGIKSEDEVAAVPVIAGVDVALRRPRGSAAPTQIALAHGRMIQLDAERDDIALNRGLSGLLAPFGKAGAVARGFEDDVGLGADLAQLVGDEKASVSKAGSASMVMAVWKVERWPTSGMNCLGRVSRDSGHTRVPEPPHMMIRNILI
jgi:hypothetical protein